MDSLESQLEAKLQKWRSDDGTEKSREQRKRKPKTVRKRAKKAPKPQAPPQEPVAPQPKLPNVAVSEEKMKESLSKTLLTARPSIKWADPLRARTLERGISKKRRNQNPSNVHARSAAEGEDAVNAATFVERHRFEVGALGSAALQKRQRKAYEAATLLRLGCRAPRNQKMPIGMLVGIRKKKKERDVKEREKKREEGVLISSKRSKRR